MSATREMLCEKINAYEIALSEAERRGMPTDYLKDELNLLRSQLENANKVLSENKTILKG